MKLLLPSLLLCVSLLTAACKKDTPAPAPDLLLGRWNPESSTYYNYNAAGQLEGQKTEVTKDYYMVFTEDYISFRATKDDSNGGQGKYTRQGNEIRYFLSLCTITELTEHTLTLHYTVADKQPNSPYQEADQHYSR
jgi:hypothetical protein